MSKFLNDFSAIGKNIWNGFVWLVDFAYELGDIIADKVIKIHEERKEKIYITVKATKEVIQNCVCDG